MCNSETLPGIFSIVKRIMSLIQIVVPILLIVFASLSLIKLLKNPEEKKCTKKIINQFIAAIIVFFIPLLVDVVMNLAGDSNEISSCWMSASDKNIINTNYNSSGEKEKKKITYDATEYEASRGELNFSCTSDTVKSQFSCETLKIVEKHLYDFDATNFNSVINNKYDGDFGVYAKSVGGIFGEYYAINMPNETESDFQRAAEYVLGWMYMYGWDYMNNSGAHGKWGGRNYTADAFYVNGGWKGKYIEDSTAGHGVGTNFDHVISGQNGGVGRMSSECGDLELFVFNKLGIQRANQLSKPTRLKDIKVGDCLFMGWGGQWDPGNERTWSCEKGCHNVVVGEVYDDRIVYYDAGGFPSLRNYKHTIMLPNESSTEADREAFKKATGRSNWGIRRWHNFE